MNTFIRDYIHCLSHCNVTNYKIRFQPKKSLKVSFLAVIKAKEDKRNQFMAENRQFIHSCRK